MIVSYLTVPQRCYFANECMNERGVLTGVAVTTLVYLSNQVTHRYCNPDERKSGVSAQANCSLDEAEPSGQHSLNKWLGKLFLSFALASAVARAKFGVAFHIVSGSCDQERMGTVGCVSYLRPFVPPTVHCWASLNM